MPLFYMKKLIIEFH